ncbi:hypothetical protein KQX54_001178, partial [Cotesia glomerata]
MNFETDMLNTNQVDLLSTIDCSLFIYDMMKRTHIFWHQFKHKNKIFIFFVNIDLN